MGLLDKRNIDKIQNSKRPYHFNGDLDKLNTGDLFVRKTGIIGLVFNKSNITEFDFWSHGPSTDSFFVTCFNDTTLTYLDFDYYKDEPRYQINKIYPNAVSIKELEEFAKIDNSKNAINFIKGRYEEIKIDQWTL